jgi:hypothetical protein
MLLLLRTAMVTQQAALLPELAAFSVYRCFLGNPAKAS